MARASDGNGSGGGLAVERVKLDKSVLDAFDALPDSQPGQRAHAWTAEEDAVLVRFWPVKRKADVARLLGVAPGTARERFNFLTGAL